MIIKNHSQQNFGWNIQTHSLLTKAALRQVPELQPYSTFLCLGTKLADISPKYTNIGGSHTYFGKDLPFNQTALDMFEDNLMSAFNWFRCGANKMGMYKSGVAMHFVQDMSLPVHTTPECCGGLKIIKHFLYETKALSYPEFIKGLVSKNNKSINFFDNFTRTYKKSTEMPNPYTLKGKKQVEESITTSLANAYNATYNFLQRLKPVVTTSDKKRLWLDINDLEQAEFMQTPYLKIN